MGAQSEILIAIKATNQPVDVLRAGLEASDTQCCKSLMSKGQPILQPGTLREPGQASIKPWSMPMIPIDAASGKRKSWIGTGPGSLPLAVAVQVDAIQKYGADPRENDVGSARWRLCNPSSIHPAEGLRLDGTGVVESE
jgi:hypothetical protein